MSTGTEPRPIGKRRLRELLGWGGKVQPLASQTQVPSSAPVLRRRKLWNSRLGVAIVVILLLLLIGSGLGIFYWLSHINPTQETISTIKKKTPSGYAFFVSSESLNVHNDQGINDELQINLFNIPSPAAGKSYFVWLLRDKNSPVATPILLGKLIVTNGSAHFLYPGDKQHSDLLAISSRILITEEDANITPINPSPNSTTWRYYTELPQTPNPNDTLHHLSMLDHLRDLLAEDPTIEEKEFHGGLVNQLLRKTEKILEWAGSARDYWGEATGLNLIRNQLIRILDYLDGVSFVQADVPPHTPPLVSAPYAILEPDTSAAQISPDYLSAILGHINGIAQAPGGTPDKLTLTQHIVTGLKDLKTWLEQVHLDAKQLIAMTNAQLHLPSTLSILDDMHIQAFYAYVGRQDPDTNTIQSGVIQIHDDTEHLAIFNVQVYNSSQIV